MLLLGGAVRSLSTSYIVFTCLHLVDGLCILISSMSPTATLVFAYSEL